MAETDADDSAVSCTHRHERTHRLVPRKYTTCNCLCTGSLTTLVLLALAVLGSFLPSLARLDLLELLPVFFWKAGWSACYTFRRRAWLENGNSTKTAAYEFLRAYLNCAEKSSVVSSSSQLSSQRRPLVVPAVAAAPAVLSAVVAASVSSAGQSVFGKKEVDELAYMFAHCGFDVDVREEGGGVD